MGWSNLSRIGVCVAPISAIFSDTPDLCAPEVLLTSHLEPSRDIEDDRYVHCETPSLLAQEMLSDAVAHGDTFLRLVNEKGIPLRNNKGVKPI